MTRSQPEVTAQTAPSSTPAPAMTRFSPSTPSRSSPAKATITSPHLRPRRQRPALWWLGNDRLEGGGGDDKLDGGPGADIINGGGGINAARHDDPLDLLFNIQNDLT